MGVDFQGTAIGDDGLIGGIPHRWNHLVGYDENVPVADISNLHYTIGGPYFDDYRDTDYADEWFTEKAAMDRCDQKPKSG